MRRHAHPLAVLRCPGTPGPVVAAVPEYLADERDQVGAADREARYSTANIPVRRH